ncbi:uncharacterized protein LAJ45_01161 [Morchella importuna]|uniref:uncharacterized protein n=1 Tax=Morchella importuna TaxID=1174673 RepID=UPI001E8EEB65|nr:uncharacterized protein LAJ45_01161 [Morchella importuna]KAH8154633.1 hypothetical protein LAJ45_01161 [Morchella importuna]
MSLATLPSHNEDVALLILCANAYRFYLWSRVIPLGRDDPVNEAGIAFYKNYVDTVEAGIPLSEDVVTSKSDVGDSSREHLIVAHTCCLAHGRAVKAYAKTSSLKIGIIGVTLMATGPSHGTCRSLDVEAAERKLEFAISWFADPIYFVKYPDSMRKQLGDRLPGSPEKFALVKGSNDFYGMNH